MLVCYSIFVYLCAMTMDLEVLVSAKSSKSINHVMDVLILTQLYINLNL